MTKEKAQDRAQRIANETGSSTLVYFTKVGHRYGVSFTLPIHGIRLGERYYPQIRIPGAFSTGFPQVF
jgi:hypothetical protein